MQRAQRNDVRLFPYGLLSLVLQRTQDHQPKGIPTGNDLGPFSSTAN